VHLLECSNGEHQTQLDDEWEYIKGAALQTSRDHLDSNTKTKEFLYPWPSGFETSSEGLMSGCGKVSL
jgi:hypothetical protein